MAGIYDFGSSSDSDTSQPAPSVHGSESSSGSPSNDLQLLPEAKRRKLVRLRGSRKAAQKITLSDEAGAAGGDSDLDAVEGVDSKGHLPALQPETSLEFNRLPAGVATTVVHDKELEALLQQNNALRSRLQQSAHEAEVSARDLQGDEDVRPSPSSAMARNVATGSREQPGSPAAADKLTLVLKTAKHSIKMRTACQESFGRLFARFKKHAVSEGWVSEAAALRFLFDGEVVADGNTPAALDMEDGDTLDVTT
ncbi:hypothetical protein WJX72_008823 [[Myrmecia] bisecta]|uniref:Ubiquitin-like domain-containing protein n=1 Tax=[Myrmecia] bisecta TaxID=41462 RepID=A0AAW1P249_9CHLO